MKKLSLSFLILLMACQKNKVEKTRKYAKPIQHQTQIFPVSKSGRLAFGEGCAFVDKNRDTIIPFGRFSVFATDTLTHFAFVKDDENNTVVAINHHAEVIFDAYFDGDAQLDQYSEGLMRVIQNGKIAYANSSGEIIFPPKYQCAFPFENGKAKVAYDGETVLDEIGVPKQVSKSWFYIQTKP